MGWRGEPSGVQYLCRHDGTPTAYIFEVCRQDWRAYVRNYGWVDWPLLNEATAKASAERIAREHCQELTEIG